MLRACAAGAARVAHACGETGGVQTAAAFIASDVYKSPHHTGWPNCMVYYVCLHAGTQASVRRKRRGATFTT